MGIATLRQAITKELHVQESGQSTIHVSDSFTLTASQAQGQNQMPETTENRIDKIQENML